ncbi:extracellular solute-binding protein [Nocardioides sp. TF02-7]|uniref:ABC transporter substrate-binding protein n=1 Tax=Nocardioides sp. TF02-7 TaxID=2917724 RepID=UPI001F06C1BA|nr:extracellular solute-binding protein [Nocardioides sp. TF02-7]UMG91257.1 extracellular solute-binding protein [Nocardioides sp. TF02-7]
MVGSLVLAVALAAACGGGDDDSSTVGQKPEEVEDLPDSTVLEAAQEEGSVVWYTSIPEAAVEEVADGFAAAYDIEVEVVRFPSTTLMQRYASERDAGTVQGDVINVAETAFFEDGLEQGWWAEFDDSEMPALGKWPTDLVTDDRYTLVNTQPIGVAYNTDHLQEGDVDSWEDLGNPDLDGELVLVNPENTPFYLSWAMLLREEYGVELLSQIADLSPSVTDSAVPGAQQLAAGEDHVMVPAVLSGVVEVQEAGAPVETTFPTPTVGVEQYAAASADGPNPNAAKLFVNYLLTRTGQEQLNRGYAASPLEDIPDALPLPDDYRATDAEAVLAERDSLLADLGL